MNVFSTRPTYKFIAFILLITFSNTGLYAQVCFGTEAKVDENNTEEIFVNLRSENFTDITTFQLSILFDTAHYEFKEFIHSSLPHFSNNYSINAGGLYGVLRIAWFDFAAQPVSIDSDSVLVSFKFKKKTDEDAAFMISNEPTQIEASTAYSKKLNVSECNTGETFVSYLNGRLIIDLNKNCQIEEDERNAANAWSWSGWNIKNTEGEKRKFSGYLSPDGSFQIPLFEDKNRISPVSPGPYYTLCTPLLEVETNKYQPDSIYELLVQIEEECPFAQVNLVSFPRKSCEENLYFINYSNHGTLPSDSAYIEVSMDYRLNVKAFTSFDGSVIDLGHNRYRLDIGSLQIGQSGSIYAIADIPCELSPEETICNQARIYPQTVCGDHLEKWSGASLRVKGRCEAEKVIFEIENIGTNIMSEPMDYVVVEDAVIFKTATIQLEPGLKEVIELEADGSFYYVKIPQEKGHPGNSNPSAFIEACGRDENGNFSTGFANQFPLDDEDYFVDISCHPLSDFNDFISMRTFPRGYGTEHYIEPNTPIEYQLFFQSSYTSSIKIVDTLSPLLDYSTFQPVENSFSYPYSFKDGVLKVIIDSETPGTNDVVNFLKFKIQPKKDSPISSRITNVATIYEDDNIIQTNQVFHTLNENFLVRKTTGVEVVENRTASTLNVSPNPSRGKVLFTLENAQINKQSILEIINLNGQIIRTIPFQQRQIEFKKGGLPAGIYLYRLQSSGEKLENGFFVLID